MVVLETSAELTKVVREKGDTFPKMLKFNYEHYAKEIAMRYKKFGIWQTYSWEDYYLNVKYLALGLLSLGFKRGDKLAIIGDNSPEWYFGELAAQANGGVSVGMYSDLTPPEIEYIVNHSEAKFALVEDQEQVDKFLQIKGKIPFLKAVIYWDPKGLGNYDDAILLSLKELQELGKQYESQMPGVFEANVERGSADDVCAIVYTSGTTGTVPKGAVHSYKTMMAGGIAHLHLDPWRREDNVVSYLPPAWMAEQWYGICCHLMAASVLNFPEEPETVQNDIREIGPRMVFYSARLWESLAAAVHARILDATFIKRLAFRLLMPIGYKVADLRLNGKKVNVWWRLAYTVANLLMFKPLRDRIGLRNARICYTSGAMLSPDAFRFFHAIGVPLKSLYGSTEGGVVSGPRTEDIKLGTVGPPIRGVEVRITETGEIIVRQQGLFLGYYKDPCATANVLKDGWFYTGDAGFFREDGHLVFTERVKDLLELRNGEKLPPQYIESRLKFSPYIKDAWLLVDKAKSYPCAVIVIDYENVAKWAEQKGIAYTTFTDLSQKAEVYELIKKIIAALNKDLPQTYRIRKFVNLHKELDPDEAELTRTRKLKRKFLEKKYATLVNAIYADKKEVLVEAEVKYRDGRVGVTKTSVRIVDVGGA